jgi:UDP-GlcNAc:undecaprenyl-phosphate GlcNAc-1-phosphate transferase
MGEYVLTMLAAAAVTYLLTPAVRRLAVAVGALQAARERDVHVVPTPLLGGFAMYAGLAAGLLVASRIPGLTPAFAQPNMAKGLLLAGGLVVVMGFVDDRWGLGALSKLAGQVAAGVILVWSGAEVTWLPLPGGNSLALTVDQQTAATILVVVVTINAVNFIDGLDGLAAGIVGIGAAAFFIYYYTLTHRLGLPDQTGPALASAVLVGMCVGFLPHNFHPARIFMGDTGAMLLGLLLAYAPISSLASLDPASLTDHAALAAGTVNRFGEFLPLLVPAVIMLIPYADLLMAVVRRTRAGTSVFAPDKKHLQHRLLALGHSHRTSVLIMYMWAGLFAASVAWLSIARTSLYILVFVTGAAVLALALLLVSMPRLRPWARAASAQKVAARGAATVAAAGQAPAEHPTAWAEQLRAPALAERGPKPASAEQRPESAWTEQRQERNWTGQGPEPTWAAEAQEAAPWQADDPVSDNDAEPGQAFPWPVASATPPADPGLPSVAPAQWKTPSEMPSTAEISPASVPADLEDTGPIPGMSLPPAKATHPAPRGPFEPAPWPGFAPDEPAAAAPSDPAPDESRRPSASSRRAPAGSAPAPSVPASARFGRPSAASRPAPAESAPTGTTPSGPAPSASVPDGAGGPSAPATPAPAWPSPAGPGPNGPGPNGSAPNGSAPAGSGPAEAAPAGPAQAAPGQADGSGPATEQWPPLPADPRLPARTPDRW